MQKEDMKGIAQPYQTPEVQSTMMVESQQKIPLGVRFLSACMVIGAAVSLIVIVLLSFQAIQNPTTLAFFIPFIFLFIFYIYKGIRLWRYGAPEYKWALLLFLVQVPLVGTSVLLYQLYTGFMVAILFGDVASNILLNAGGGFNFYMFNQVENAYFGVNLFALGASIYLFCLLKAARE